VPVPGIHNVWAGPPAHSFTNVMLRTLCPSLMLLAVIPCAAQVKLQARADAAGFRERVQPFLKSYCSSCHGSRKPKGDVSFARIGAEIVAGKDVDLWSRMLEQLSLRSMPPAKKKKQPTDVERQAAVDWITGELEKIGAAPDPERLLLPRFGNRVHHEQLFSGDVQGEAFSYSRLWRISPHVYDQFARDMSLYKKVSQPLSAVPGRNFQDFSILYADEVSIGSLLRNSKKVARILLRGRNPKRPGPRYREYKAVLEAGQTYRV
jgi:mono/diheme cytochrome c family protein